MALVTLRISQDTTPGRLPTVNNRTGDIIEVNSRSIADALTSWYKDYRYICTIGKYQLRQDLDGLYHLIWEEEE